MNDITHITPSTIYHVLQINRPTIPDDRGFFRESVRIKDIEAITGTPFHVVQANHARSTRLTLRGIHVAPWNKVIYVTRGEVQAVIVDVRVDSPTFGKYQSFLLGDENRTSLFVPAGCGNSYLVLSPEADYTYLTDQEWEAGKEFSIAWNDPTLAIKWQLTEPPILSEKDQANKSIKTLFPDKF